MPERLKIVILDDNDERRYLIRDMLPDYVDAFFSPISDNARNLILQDASGRCTDLVIMNADDETGTVLNVFTWMREEEETLFNMPVLLLCEDTFSDNVMPFLEIGDAEFAEGEIDPDRLFMQIMDMIDAAEKAPEKWTEPSYTEKESTRIQGLSVKPVGEDEDTVRRSIVLQHEEQLKQLEQALERGRQKQEKRKELMALAEQYQSEIPVEEPLHRLNGEEALKVLVQEAPAEVEEETKATIVVVDYDVRNRKLCELFLQRDYRVVSISTGMNTIDYFVKNKADLLILSTDMPILDGFKILNSIRWQPNGKRLPVIFMAEGDPEEARKKCQLERVVGVLMKPVSKSALRRSVDAVLSTVASTRR